MIQTKMLRRFATASLLLLASSAVVTASEGQVQSAGKLRSLGEQAMIEGKYSEAVTYYSQVIKMEPEKASNFFKLFRVHNRMRNYVSALRDITQACEVAPDENEYRYQKAKLLVSLGQCDEALSEYKIINSSRNKNLNFEEVTTSMNDANACSQKVNAATAAFQARKYEEARHYFGLALSHMEQAPDLLFMKAQAQYHLEDYFGVISDTGKILKIHSRNIEAYQLRGEAYFRTGEHDIALQHFREGLKLDPEHKGCKAAHKLIKSIAKKEKRGDDALKIGEHTKAVEYWIQAIEIDNTHRAFARPTMLKIIKSLSQSGKHDEAISMAESHVEESETLDGIFALGDALTGGDKFQEAVNIFRKATDFEPNDRQQETQAKLRKAEIALKQSKEKNYYKILQVPRTADKKSIKTAYRKLALEWHPDKNEDKVKAEKMFQDISEAYEVLSDQEMKAKYDRGEDVFDNQGGGGGGHQGFPDQMFRQHFQNGGGGGRRGGGGGSHHFHFG